MKTHIQDGLAKHVYSDKRGGGNKNEYRILERLIFFNFTPSSIVICVQIFDTLERK